MLENEHMHAQVTFRKIPRSETIEAYIQERAAKLETFCDRITGCHVAIESPHRHQLSGRHYRVLIDLTVPGAEIVVSHSPDERLANHDLHAAIDEAFDKAGRQLQDRLHRQRGNVKAHASG